MKRTILWLACCLLLVGGTASAEVTAGEAFAALKGLAGTWHGSPEGVGAEAAAAAEAAGRVTHEIQLSANETVVMETMGPGSEHEMINMYHLDGDDLVLTHYCAGGNQPRMRLDRAASTAERLVFDFDGGTNLDPEADAYIRSAEIHLAGDGELVSSWTSWSAGKPSGGMIFRLARAE